MATATSNFRRQHEELVALAVELLQVIETERGADTVPRVQSILNRLAGKLKVHKAMEEEALYPDLLSHEKPSVRELAAGFQKQFGTVYSAFVAFREQWGTERVRDDYAKFVPATRDLVAALAERIEQEDGELYAMVDELYGGAAPTGGSS